MQSKECRARNWKEYNRSLVKRGEITLWIESSVFDEPQTASPAGKGRPRLYSDPLIEAGLVLKNVYQLTFRQLEGFILSLHKQAGTKKKAPNYTTLCRRQNGLSVPLGWRKQRGAMTLVIDSTGLKIVGEGEWCVKKHGAHYQRTWRKVHIVVDAGSLDIVSCRLSESRKQDSDMLEPLLQEVKEPIARVIGDGAYDNFKCFESVKKRKAQGIFPPRWDARTSYETRHYKKAASEEAIKQRDKIIEKIRHSTKAEWKRESGYHQRSLAETTMFRLKTILGERLKAKKWENQELEVKLRCAILNKMNQLQTQEMTY